jgi:cold shock CspA family protein
MRGVIKFVDPKTRSWGFIITPDNGRDVHFVVADFIDAHPTPSDNGADVEFDLKEDSQGPHAKNVRFLGQQPLATQKSAPLSCSLKNWAFVPFFPFRSRDGRDYSSVLELLATKALGERWYFGKQPGSNPWSVLENYFKYTFVRLQRENKVAEVGAHATFNTGLVDRLYDPIFALFDLNPQKGAQRWAFYDFCVPGKGQSGKKLTAAFDPLPDPPSYFTSKFDMLLESNKDIHVDYDHVILDGIGRDRFPAEFLRQHVPKGMTWEDPRLLGPIECKEYLANFAGALNEDLQTLRSIKYRLEDARMLAERCSGPHFLDRRTTLS